MVNDNLTKKNFFKMEAFQKLMALSALVLLVIVFSIASPNFFTKMNFISILLMTAVNGVLAIGVTFVIITGGIDLSIGTGMTFASVMTGVAITFMGLPIWLGVLTGLLAGTLCGFASGVGIAKFKLPPFIATLGMMMITKGLSLIISGTKPIYFENAGFRRISTGTLADIPGIRNIHIPILSNILYSIPFAVYILIIAAVVAHIILTKTVLGRYNIAIGSNEEATRLSGINTDRWKIAIYSLNGLFFGLAGILMAARLNSAQPALGQGYELDAIAAVVIGGTSMSGGKGTITGTIIGAFIISVLINGLRILSVPQEWQTVVTGVIVIGAVYMDIVRRRKQQ